jgi:GGDEF domain-containing protein/rubrerythrin
MTEEVLRHITTLCLDLDKRSAEIYSRMASLADKGEMKKFWQQMAAEERLHVKFWQKIVDMADREILPNVFEDPEQTRRELGDIHAKVNAIWEAFIKDPEKASSFLLAYRMEFYLIHPAIGTLFHYMKGISPEENPLDTYEAHLSHLNDMVLSQGSITPEMELLSEVIQALWNRNRDLARRSAIDELTGVFNRRGFFDTITPLLHLSQRHQYPVAVMMLDIDDFKHVNDTQGHQAGDKVLKGVASILRNNVRSSDIVGRYGGRRVRCLFQRGGTGDGLRHRRHHQRENSQETP